MHTSTLFTQKCVYVVSYNHKALQPNLTLHKYHVVADIHIFKCLLYQYVPLRVYDLFNFTTYPFSQMILFVAMLYKYSSVGYIKAYVKPESTSL